MELGGRVSRCASPWGWCRGSMGQGAGLRTSRQGVPALLSQVWGPRALCKRPRLQVTVHAAPEGSLGCFVRARGPQPQACPRIPRPLCWGTFRVSVRGQREGWRSPRRGRAGKPGRPAAARSPPPPFFMASSAVRTRVPGPSCRPGALPDQTSHLVAGHPWWAAEGPVPGCLLCTQTGPCPVTCPVRSLASPAHPPAPGRKIH